jgi:hypothetical protein
MAEPARSTPHLLSLPREIRDHIYSYLDNNDHDDWGLTELFTSKGGRQFRFHNAPLLSVLHTHPRLRTEYMEAAWTDKITATLRTGSYGGPYNTQTEEAIRPSTLPIDFLFAHHIRHITILVDIGAGYYFVESWWEGLQELVTSVVAKTPLLSTIRVGMLACNTIRIQDYNQIWPPFRSSHYLATPPPRLHAFLLVQRAEGYRLDEEGTGSSRIRRNRRHRLRGEHVKKGCYLYALGDYEDHVWTPEDALDVFPTLERSADGSIEILVKAKEMKAWRQKRGHEAAVAWFSE